MAPLKRGYQAEPMLLSVVFGMSLAAALPDALLALWFKFLAEGVLNGRRRLALAAALPRPWTPKRSTPFSSGCEWSGPT